MKRLVIQLGLTLFSSSVLADQTKHFVIQDGEFMRHLSAKGRLGRQPKGTLMRISFDYQDYDRLHPYLIANQFCQANQVIRWGSAPHPSLGQIELVCVRGDNANASMSLTGGQ